MGARRDRRGLGMSGPLIIAGLATWMWALGVIVVCLAYRGDFRRSSVLALALMWPISMPVFWLVTRAERAIRAMPRWVRVR